MTAELRGDGIAREIREDVAGRAAELRARGVTPTLAIVLATEDGGALWYSRAIAKAAEKEEIECRLLTLSPAAGSAEIAAAIGALADDDGVHGIILQSPLPPGADAAELSDAIPPEKDVDGMSALSAGRLALGRRSYAPATAEAVMRILRSHEVELSGREVAIVGRSAVVGKPLAQLLLGADATVTVCHSRTRDLPQVTARADVLVVAVGRARFAGGDFVKPGATVIDVGTNEEPDGSLAGDVDAQSVEGVAGSLTPVPGGVGSVTTATLLRHTVEAAERASA
jgi:methylenetetrahydrofolate dehydrogenase (NADP+) / methenyltetrahydrofolate cyclohydrolase